MKNERPILLTFISLTLCGGIVLELIQGNGEIIHIIKLSIFLFITTIITSFLWGIYFATKGTDRNVGLIDGEEIVYFQSVEEINFNTSKNSIEIKGFTQLKNTINEVKILNINKINWNNEWIYNIVDENGLILQGFSINILNKNYDNPKRGSIIKKIFFKSKFKQKYEEVYNIYFEAGDIFECNILAEEIVLNGEKIKLL